MNWLLLASFFASCLVYVGWVRVKPLPHFLTDFVIRQTTNTHLPNPDRQIGSIRTGLNGFSGFTQPMYTP